MEALIDPSEVISLGLGIAALALVGLEFRKRTGRHASRYTDLSADNWQSYALERGWHFHGSGDKGGFRGDIDGQPFSADVAIRRRHYRTRYGGRQEYVTATSKFRVPIRGLAPPLTIQRNTFLARLKLVMRGVRPFATDVLELDEALLISGADVDEVVPLVRKPAVRQALKVWTRLCPESTLHERAVQMTVDGMVSDSRELDRTLQALTAVAAAIEMSVAQRDGSAPILPPRAPEPAPVVQQRVVDRPEALNQALRRLARQSSKQQAMTAQHLRLPPYTFELEVRGIGEAVNSLGVPNGDYQVNGMLTRDNWRVELRVPKDQANTVLLLMTGDVITGQCLLDDVRPIRKTVEASTTHPIALVSKGAVHEDAVR